MALGLAGIVAMHGLSVTDLAGTHRGPAVVSASSDSDHGEPEAGMPSPATSAPEAGQAMHDARTATADDMPARDVAALVLRPASSHDGHTAMAACVAVLLGLLSVAALRLRGRSMQSTRARAGSRGPISRVAARAPPQPIFLVLCVFRN